MTNLLHGEPDLRGPCVSVGKADLVQVGHGLLASVVLKGWQLLS